MAVAATLVAALVTAVPNTADGGKLTKHQKRHMVMREQAQFNDPQAPTGDPAQDAQRMATMPMAAASSAPPPPDRASVLKKLPASVGGKWMRRHNMPFANAYHMIMGPQGQILLLAGSGNSATTFAAGTFKAYLWDPVRGVRKTLRVPTDMFCSGHVLLSNGKGLAVGGTASYSPRFGSKAVYTFDFIAQKFVRQSDMFHGRWYPSVVRNPDATEMITSGYDEQGHNSGSTEMYDEATGKTMLMSEHTSTPFPLYPQFIMRSATRYFYTGMGWSNAPTDTVVHAPGFWNPATDAFSPVSGLSYPRKRGSGATCLIGDARLGNMVLMGGGWPATRSVNLINLNARSPHYRTGPSLRSAKAYVSCVRLPNGSILELNGGNANRVGNASHEVAMLKSIYSKSWTPMNPIPAGSNNHRLYHSMAFMMDDGSVVSIGSNPVGQARSNSVWQFYPPYFYKKGVRPAFTSAPRSFHYGQRYRLRFGSAVTRIALTTRSSPTHSMDDNARSVILAVKNGYVTMHFTAQTIPKGYVTITALGKNGKVGRNRWAYIS